MIIKKVFLNDIFCGPLRMKKDMFKYHISQNTQYWSVHIGQIVKKNPQRNFM